MRAVGVENNVLPCPCEVFRKHWNYRDAFKFASQSANLGFTLVNILISLGT